MKPVEYLYLEDLIELIRVLGVGPIRDVGLLDSATHRPRSGAFGEDAYPTFNEKVAALLHSLVNNHALVDGNKRLAWLAAATFCDLNNFRIDLTNDEAFHLVVSIASTSIGVPDIAKQLKLTKRSGS